MKKRSDYMDGISNSPVSEKISNGKLLAFGLQQVLAMYAGSIAVPLVLGNALKLPASVITVLIAASCFVVGLTTVLQGWGIGKFIGVRLPVVLGSSFVLVSPLVTVATSLSNEKSTTAALTSGQTTALLTMLGATIFAGIVLILIAPLMSKITALFSDVVIGCMLLSVGTTLFKVTFNSIVGYPGTPSYGDSKAIWLALMVLVVIILLNKFLTGFLRDISVLLGMAIGFIAAIFMGMVDFTPVKEATFISFVTPFKFGTPIFTDMHANTMVTIASIVTTIQAIGCFYLLCDFCNTPMRNQRMTTGLRTQGVGILLGGMFNAFSSTIFSQNVGLVILSGVKTRWVTVTSGFILILLGILPKCSAFATIIPAPVLGAGILTMFGMVMIAGITTLHKVDMSNIGNMIIVAVSVGVGLTFDGHADALAKMPDIIKSVLSDGNICTVVLAILLNLLFNFKEIKKSFKQKKEENAAA